MNRFSLCLAAAMLASGSACASTYPSATKSSVAPHTLPTWAARDVASLARHLNNVRLCGAGMEQPAFLVSLYAQEGFANITLVGPRDSWAQCAVAHDELVAKSYFREGGARFIALQPGRALFTATHAGGGSVPDDQQQPIAHNGHLLGRLHWPSR